MHEQQSVRPAAPRGFGVTAASRARRTLIAPPSKNSMDCWMRGTAIASGVKRP